MNRLWYLIFITAFIWSAIDPKDFFTWVLEVAPAVIAFVLLIATRDRFPFTTVAYSLILIHSIILFVGGHYTYAEVPLFNLLSDTYDLGRNHYDKLGHFAQGFVPAIVAREILIRNGVIKSSAWLPFVVVCICLAISAFYELLEWWIALLSEEAAESFLGTQGYIWDTQSDMGFALLGAIVALSLLSKLHDRQIQHVDANFYSAI